MPDWEAGSGSSSWSYTDPHNDLTHQWMMEANAFNAEQAQITRDWQEKMSNTAYQRAMSDMAKAGLNPILAGNLGGASTPGGATATANFTGAGATSSGGSSSWSRSIGESLYNLGMGALNEASMNTFGNDLSALMSKGMTYITKLFDDFIDDTTSSMQNGANQSSRPAPHNNGTEKRNGAQHVDVPQDSNEMFWSDVPEDATLWQVLRSLLKDTKRNAYRGYSEKEGRYLYGPNA